MPTGYTVTQGPVGVESWVTDQRPKSWRAGINQLFPAGAVPMLALTNRMRHEKVDDPEYNWWARAYPAQAGVTLDVWANVALDSAYASGGVANDTVYVGCIEATAQEFRARNTAIIRDTTDFSKDTHVSIEAVVLAGANSYLACKLIEADQGSLPTATPRIIRIGSAQQEGAEQPDSIVYLPEKQYNYTQIEEETVDITRTAMRTRLRTGSSYQDQKKMALLMHYENIERSFIYGQRYATTVAGKRKYYTRGIVPWLRAVAPAANIVHYPSSAYSTQTWAAGGWDYLDDAMQALFRYTSDGNAISTPSRLAFCGYGALGGINRLAREYGHINMPVGGTAFGLAVMKWITPYGTLNLFPHPLFNLESSEANSILAIEPRNFRYRYVDDTFFKKDPGEKQGGSGRVDGRQESWLTECGLEFHYPELNGYFTGVGQDGNDVGGS